MKRFHYALIIYCIALSFVSLFMVYPAADDWGYCIPRFNVDIAKEIMPSVIFWRPFHNILSSFLGYFPFLFPYINKILCLTCHFILLVVLYHLIKRITKNNFAVITGVTFFCLSPGIVYTVTNPDIFEQGLAFATGILSAYFFFRAKIKTGFHYYILYFVTAFMAALFREEGIVWFIAPVMLFCAYSYAENNENILCFIRENYVQILIGILGTISYFALRFYLAGTTQLGMSEGKYAVNFSVINIIKNYCLMIGGSATSLDPLAIFLEPRNFPIIIITSITTLIFVIYIVMCLIDIFINNRKTFWIITGLFTCAGYISSPFSVITRATDNAAYEMLFMLALIFGVITASTKKFKYMKLILYISIFSMFFVQCHKFYTLINYSSDVNQILVQHESDFKNKPSKVFVYYIEDIPEKGYSAFCSSLGKGLWYGAGFNSLWDWKAGISRKNVSDDLSINIESEKMQEYDTIFSLSRSGKIKILKN